MSLGGKAVRDGRELQTVVAGLPFDKPTEVEIVREGKRQILRVTVVEQPKNLGVERVPEPRPGETRPSEKSLVLNGLGLELIEMTPELAEAQGFPKGVKGVLIYKVVRGGLASAEGIHSGMLLVGINRKSVTSLKDVGEALSAGSALKGVLLRVQDTKGRVRQMLVQE